MSFNLDFELLYTSNELLKPQLHFKELSITYYFTWLVVASFLLIAIARITNPGFLLTIVRGISKNKSIEKITSVEHPISFIGSTSLLLNFLVCASTLLFIQFNTTFTIPFHETVLISILVPIIILFAPILLLYFVEIISGEKGLLKEIKLTNWILFKGMGILLSIILLIVVFSRINSSWMFLNINYLLIIAYLYRVFRGFIFSIQKGISWYYIILYFCTFEILPLLILYNGIRNQFE